MKGQSHPDVRAIRTKELSTKLLLLQFKSSLRNGRSTRKYTSFEGFISPPKALPSALLSKIPCFVHCSQQNYHFFFKIFSTQTDLVLISRHRHALLSVLIRERRLTRVFRNKTLLHTANKYPCCHIPPAYICQHLCATMALALFLPSP